MILIRASIDEILAKMRLRDGMKLEPKSECEWKIYIHGNEKSLAEKLRKEGLTVEIVKES